MANKTVAILAPTGLTLTLEVYPDGSDTIANTGGDALTEATNRKGLYTCTVTEALSGLHTAHIKQSGTVIGVGFVYLVDEVGTYWVRDYVLADNRDGEEIVTTSVGTGARSVTITVDDGSDELENARVRFTEGSNTFTALTNSSGVATFALDDATYTLAITKAGYSFTPTTQVVDGTETITKSMSAIVITPGAGPDQTTGYLTTYDGQGESAEDVEITFRLVKPPGNEGQAFDGDEFTGTSGEDGLLEVTLLREAKYEAWRGTRGRRVTFKTDDESTYQLPEVLGVGD